jgi:hypothetical protein
MEGATACVNPSIDLPETGLKAGEVPVISRE